MHEYLRSHSACAVRAVNEGVNGYIGEGIKLRLGGVVFQCWNQIGGLCCCGSCGRVRTGGSRVFLRANWALGLDIHLNDGFTSKVRSDVVGGGDKAGDGFGPAWELMQCWLWRSSWV